MSKILIYTDPHVCTNSSVIRTRGDVFSTRLENLQKTFVWINKFAEEEKVDDIICLGDFFDAPNLTSEEITAVQSFNVGHHKFLVGNHDSNRADLVFSSVNIFDSKNVINKATYWEKENILFLPYSIESEKFDLDSLCNKDTIILSHNDLKGVQYGGYMSQSGMDVDYILSHCTLFINGHIHNGNIIKETDRSLVMNLGSITGLNFNNDVSVGWKPSCMILDTETRTYRLFENPHAFLFYNVYLPTEEAITEFMSTLEFDRPNIVSIKVPSKLMEFAKQVKNDNSDLLYYCRLVPDYMDQEGDVVKDVAEQFRNTHFTSMNHFQKLEQFIARKFSEDSLNYKLMIEEVRGIQQ